MSCYLMVVTSENVEEKRIQEIAAEHRFLLSKTENSFLKRSLKIKLSI